MVRDCGKVVGFGVMGVLMLALLVVFPIGAAYAQGAGKALDCDGINDYFSVSDSTRYNQRNRCDFGVVFVLSS